MNKRILEIAKQAGFGLHQDGEIYTSRLEHLPITEHIEKLAQLIARECASIARNANLEDVDGGDSAVLRAAGDQIEKHFGIK